MKYLFLGLWLLCLAAVTALAVVPNLIATNPGADKMLHLTVFCLLMIWPTMTFQKTRSIGLAMFGLFFIGVGIEFAQTQIPGRNFEILDMFYNCAGAAAGFMIGFLMRDSYQSLIPIAQAHTHMKQSGQTP